MTTSTREHQNSEEKPNKRKKISSSSNGSADNSTKKTTKRSMPKSKQNSNVIELTDFSSMENKDLVKIAKERKIKESPKDRTDLINTLYALEAEEKDVTIGAGILDIKDIIINDGGSYFPYIGFLVSFLIGYISLRLLIFFTYDGKLWYFSIYCFIVGLIAIFLF